MVVSSLVTNDRWQWSVVAQYLTWPSVLTGLWGTLRLTFAAAVIGFGLGTVLALMRLSRSPLLRSVAWGYTWVFRSVPLILQLLLWYNLAYLYPELSFGIPFGPAFAEVGHPRRSSASSAPRCSVSGSRRRRTRPRSSAPASSASTRASTRPPPRSASRAPASSCASCSRRPCGPSCRRRSTRSSAWSRARRWSTCWPTASCSTPSASSTAATSRSSRCSWSRRSGTSIITTVLTVGQYYLERHYAKGALRTLPPTPVQRLRWSVLGRRSAG